MRGRGFLGVLALGACATAPVAGTLGSGTVAKPAQLVSAGVPTEEEDRALSVSRSAFPDIGYARCFTSASRATGARVAMTYDVTVRGRAANIRVTEATAPCFERFAIDALTRWRFAPRVEDGRLLPSIGEESAIAFSFHGPAPR